MTGAVRVGGGILREVTAIAVRAAWRPAMLITGIVAVPTAVVHAALASIGVPGASPIAAGLVGTVLGGSVIVHEAGHALAVRLLAVRHPPPQSIDPTEMIPAGSWSSGRILRWSLGVGPDAAVAAAGPAAGALCVLPAVTVASTAAWTIPLVALFVIHPLSLRRRHPDGAQFAALLTGSDAA